MIKGLIFSLDGVIADLDGIHLAAWQRTCSDLGFRFDRNDYTLLKNLSSNRAAQLILDLAGARYSESDIDRLCRKKRQYFLQKTGSLQSSALTTGILEFITQSSDAGFLNCALSSNTDTSAVLEKLGAADLFDCISDQPDVSAEQMLERTADAMKLLPSECILFDRRFAVIAAARSLSMRTVGYAASETASCSDYCINSFLNLDVQILIRKIQGE